MDEITIKAINNVSIELFALKQLFVMKEMHRQSLIDDETYKDALKMHWDSLNKATELMKK